MSSVTFSISVGGDGSTVTDDTNPVTGLGNGGHRLRFVPALSQVVSVASFVVSQANLALTYANNANNAAAAAILSAASVSGTSTTSLAIASSGTATLTTQTGKSFYPGQTLIFQNDTTHWMRGLCASYNSGTGSIAITVANKKGTGTFASWNITVATSPLDLTVAYSSVSTTSLAIGLGTKTLTIEGDKLFVPGNLVTLYNSAAKAMSGTVTSYNADTGALVMEATWVDSGTGTYASWTVSLSGGISDLASQFATASYISQMMS